jgi:hypothetical protein
VQTLPAAAAEAVSGQGRKQNKSLMTFKLRCGIGYAIVSVAVAVSVLRRAAIVSDDGTCANIVLVLTEAPG